MIPKLLEKCKDEMTAVAAEALLKEGGQASLIYGYRILLHTG